MEKAKFTEPTICHYGFDMSKDWFVYFRITNPDTGEEELKVFKKGINRIKVKSERIKAINTLRDVLTYKLNVENWNPFIKEQKVLSEPPKSIYQRTTDYVELKKKSSKSVRTYVYAGNLFKSWLQEKNYDKLTPHQFTQENAYEYLEHLILDKNFNNTTYNNQLSLIKSFYNYWIKKDKSIPLNPFVGIDERSKLFGKNHAFTSDERTELKDLLYAGNIRLYYFVQFMYFCFIRRSELIRLQVGDIDFENRSIIVRSEDAKNSKPECVVIPLSFEYTLTQMNLRSYPAHYYVFGHGLNTCEKRLVKPDYITEMHKVYLNLLKLPDEKTLYSWKHTGVVEMWNAMKLKDPYALMRQLRHSDLTTTMIYLKSLGLAPNEAIRTTEIRF